MESKTWYGQICSCFWCGFQIRLPGCWALDLIVSIPDYWSQSSFFRFQSVDSRFNFGFQIKLIRFQFPRYGYRFQFVSCRFHFLESRFHPLDRRFTPRNADQIGCLCQFSQDYEYKKNINRHVCFKLFKNGSNTLIKDWILFLIPRFLILERYGKLTKQELQQCGVYQKSVTLKYLHLNAPVLC